MDNNQAQQKIVLSAMKPSGNLHLGNLIGAGKNWLKMQEDYFCYYAVADLHSITEEILTKDLREYTLDLFCWFMAIGIDPNKSVLFVQSQVPHHAELAWVLNCFTQYGEARRMTQFKDKSLKNPDNINLGLFSYPTLMAADILLYGAHYVPIGKDQKQHLELARTIANRFNNRYSPTFVEPEGIFPKLGAKIFSLSDPHKKMGKSENDPKGVVLLKDDPATVERKFKSAVTDSETEVKYNVAKKPGVSNLLVIYAEVLGLPIKTAEKHFENKSYAELKEGVAKAVIDTLIPLQQKYNSFRANKENLAELLKQGSDKASFTARKMLSKVYRKVGFV
ncbi:MAG: tryptophan--tRNA ligase [Firmicutes bacterium]|nr:tryptophan--tRNA ligase [Bacillota bacterium]